MTILTMKTIGLCLQTLDVLFFRDGRPFMSGTEQMVSGLPLPQTLAGALRTALLRAAGCDFGRLRQALEQGQSFAGAVKASCGDAHPWISKLTVRGPWLARCGNGPDNVEVLVPVPATLHQAKDQRSSSLHCLTPLPENQLPGWHPPQGPQNLRPLWLKHLRPTEPATGYLTPQGLERFLNGGKDILSEDVVAPDELFGIDYRTGIGISPDRLVAEESQIFGRGFLVLKQEVGFYAEVRVPVDAPIEQLFDQIKTLPFGGEGRHVTLKRMPQPCKWPNKQPDGKQKPMMLLTTPCPFQLGWRPQALDGHIVAAAVPGSIAFSGWDLARGGPKPTRFAVPAGSVYFLQSLPDNWQTDNWQNSLAENEEDCQQGWGCCLTGVWTNE